MKRILSIGTGAVVVMALGLFAGCSSEDSNPAGGGGGTTGNPNDPNFLAAMEFLDEADAEGSWTRSFDLTFELLDQQFPTSPRPPGPRADAAQDILIDSAMYTFPGLGWHVWHAWFKSIEDLDTADVEAWDSVRVWAAGQWQTGLDLDTLSLLDADSIEIRTHFWWDAGSGCTGAGHQANTLYILDVGTHGAFQADIMVNDTLNAAASCISDNCTLLLSWDVDFDNITFPLDSLGEPEDCPTSGAGSIIVDFDLQCSGAGDPRFDTLSINGLWTLGYNVQPNGDVNILASDGTTTWGFTDTCEVSSPVIGRMGNRTDR